MSSRIKLNKLWPKRCEGRHKLSKLFEGVSGSVCLIWSIQYVLAMPAPAQHQQIWLCICTSSKSIECVTLWRVSKYVKQGLYPEFQICFTLNDSFYSSTCSLIKYTTYNSCDISLECKQSKVHLLHKFLLYEVRSAAVWWRGECNLIPLQT